MNRRLLSLISLVLISINVWAQKGTLRGKIIDETNGETLIGATIMAVGTTSGTSSDFDGNYSLPLEPGTYTIRISFISYEAKEFENIEIKAGEVTLVNTSLGESKLTIGEAVVTARTRNRTENALQMLQKKAPKVIDGISAEQISKLGDSNAAQALKRVTGVSVQGGKYVYVRGLGDRYTITTLNGAEIPALDPEKNAVQMDIFPSNLIENILVNKTFSPEMPGEATGGLVDIITKDFPEKFTFQFSTSLGYNPQANLNQNFLTYEGSNSDILGFDNGKRNIPEQAKQALEYMVANDLGGINTQNFTSQEISEITKSFNSQMEPIKEQSFLNHSHKLSVGDQRQLFNRALGYNFALSYARNFKYYDNGGYAPLQEGNVVDPLRVVSDEKGNEEVIISGLLNLNYKLNNNNKIGFRYLRTQSGNSQARYREGTFNYEDPSGNIMTQDRQLGYLERSMSASQIHGKHVIPSLNKMTIEWLSSYTNMNQDEPDLRFFENLWNTESNMYYIKTNDVPARFFREMNEKSYFNKIDFELPFNLFANKAKLSFGGAYSYKKRSLDEVSFEISMGSSSVIPPLGATYFLDNYAYSPQNTDGYKYEADRINNLINSYTAEQTVMSGYAMMDFKLGNKNRVVAGARLETSDLHTDNNVNKEDNNYRKGELDEVDLLPSLNFTHSINEDMNVRLAVTQTIARPKFKEIGTSYYDYKTGIKTYGNAELKRSKISNIDLRWEYFFNTGEKIAISGFYKYFEDPIEIKILPDVNNMELKYFNSKNSVLYGLEIELRKKLDFISFLKDFSIGGNLTLVKSEVFLTKEEAIDRELDPEKSHTREMYGQAPYVANAFLSYTNTRLNLSSSIGFNVSGEKLFLITKGTTPYVYEQPKPNLKFTLDKGIGEKLSVSFTASNLLDSKYDAVYHFDNQDHSFLNYSEGRTFKLGVKYAIK